MSYREKVLSDRPIGYWNYDGTRMRDQTGKRNEAPVTTGTLLKTTDPFGGLAARFGGAESTTVAMSKLIDPRTVGTGLTAWYDPSTAYPYASSKWSLKERVGGTEFGAGESVKPILGKATQAGTFRYSGAEGLGENTVPQTTTAFTIIAVLKWNATTDLMTAIHIGNGGQNGYGLQVYQSKRTLLFGNVSFRQSPNNVQTSTPEIWTVRSGPSMRINGTDEGALTGSGSPNAPAASTTIGRQNDGTSRFDGDIGDILVWDNALSDANCLLVERWLGERHGITVA